jgi:hypothetical protein
VQDPAIAITWLLAAGVRRVAAVQAQPTPEGQATQESIAHTGDAQTVAQAAHRDPSLPPVFADTDKALVLLQQHHGK